jgi:type I restriction enzyme M protein
MCSGTLDGTPRTTPSFRDCRSDRKAASANPKRSDLDEFVRSFHAENCHERTESERFKGFNYDEFLKPDRVNLDTFWLMDGSLEDSCQLPDPNVLALETARNWKQRWNSFDESQKI